MDLKLKLSYFLTKLKLNAQTKMNKNRLKSGTEEKTYVTPYDLFKGINSDFISINIDNREELNNDFFEIIHNLIKRGKKVEIRQNQKEVLNIEDIKRLEKIDSNILVDFRFLINSSYVGYNVDTSYDAKTYLQIYDKFNFLSQVAKEHFKTQDEQYFFVVSQLNDYISCDDSDLENLELSSLKGAFMNRKTVCIGFSLALQRVCTQLNIPCVIMAGSNKSTNLPNHAWNKVRLNGIWYNAEITWLNTQGNIDQLLASDKDFQYHEAKAPIEEHKCTVDYPQDKISQLYSKMSVYKNVLEEYDKGVRKIAVLPIKTDKLKSSKRENIIIRDKENDVDKDLMGKE